MKNYEHIIGEAVRVEISEIDGKVFLIFEITDAVTKKNIREEWLKDIEYKIIGKNLIK
jgi:hypothetical protein